MSRERYSIGDVEPLPSDADIALARAIQRHRGAIVRNAQQCNGVKGNRARKILSGLAENRLRETDPVEMAKTYLRKRGFVPVYREGRIYVVGNERIEGDKAFMLFARGKGFEG